MTQKINMYITDRNGKRKGIPNGVPTQFMGIAKLPKIVSNDNTVAIHKDISSPFINIGGWMDREQISLSTDAHVRQLYQLSARHGINTPEFLTAVIDYFDWREDKNPTYWENQPGHINEIITRCAKGYQQREAVDKNLHFTFTEEHAKQFAEDYGLERDIVGDNGSLRKAASNNGGIPKVGDKIKYYRKEVREIGTKKNPKTRTIYYLNQPVQDWAYLYPPFMNEEFVRKFYDTFYMFASAKWKADEDWVMELDNIVMKDDVPIIHPSHKPFGSEEPKGLDSIQSEVEAWVESKESDEKWDSMGDAERLTATTKKRRSIIRHCLFSPTGLPIWSVNKKSGKKFVTYVKMIFVKSGISQTGVRWSVTLTTATQPHTIKVGSSHWAIMDKVLMADMSGRGDEIAQERIRNPVKENVYGISIPQLQAAYKKESRRYERMMRPPDGPVRLVVPSPEYAYATDTKSGKKRIQFAIYNPVSGLIEATKQKFTDVVKSVLGTPKMDDNKPIKQEYEIKQDDKGTSISLDASNISDAGIEAFLNAARSGLGYSADFEEE